MIYLIALIALLALPAVLSWWILCRACGWIFSLPFRDRDVPPDRRR